MAPGVRLRCRHPMQLPAWGTLPLNVAILDTQLTPVLDEAQAGRRHVFVVDAAHFVLGAWLGYLWCLTRVLLPTPSGRQRFNVLGALHAVTPEVITVTNDPYINSDRVVTLLNTLAERLVDLPMTLVLDNARYQRNTYVMSEADRLGITLRWLPTYSPNLNRIERLWKYVKAECLHGRYDPNFQPVQQAITHCLAQTSGRHPAKLKTLLTLNFQVFKSTA